MKTAKTIEREQWLQRRRANHHKALETLAQTVGCQTDGLKLWRQLRRLESKTSKAALDYCNGVIGTDEWQELSPLFESKIATVFGGRLPDGVFINADARGYALKLDNEKVTVPQGMEKDWGGYGILAAEID